MTNPHDTSRPPSAKQIRYLKNLAKKMGRSFAWPSTSRQASEEIRALKEAEPVSAEERQEEHQQIQGDLARQSGGAARVEADELSGWASSAAWGGPKLPSQKQLDYIESLTKRLGLEFSMPSTSGEASREIDRLLTIAGERGS